MILGWRPQDLKRSFFPLFHGYGGQIGLSDPAFMRLHGKQPMVGPNNRPVFPYDSVKLDQKMETDENAREIATLGIAWSKEFQGQFRTWEDLKFLRENWDGPLVLKGIQRTEVFFLPTARRLEMIKWCRTHSDQSSVV